MPSNLALVIGLGMIAGILYYDEKYVSRVSKASWVPLIWLLIISSRFVSQWIWPDTMWIGAEEYMEGSPLDRIIFLLLIIIGLVILARREIDWNYIFSNNLALICLISFQAVSIVWSDYPFVASKRWIKAFGDFVMVLVVLTDTDPEEGIKTILRRLAYVHVPLSIILIKYFPHLSRSFDAWTGMGFYKGVGTSKNMLGNICLVSGYYLIWSLLTQLKNGIYKKDKINFMLHIGIFLMTLWTLRMADSATSLGALVISSILLIIMGTSLIKRMTPYFGTIIVVTVFVVTFLQLTFNIVEVVINMLGRDMTFTTRTDLWQVVLSIPNNPVIGTGYESFWLGDRMKAIWAIFWYRPNQAHNGYLEVYLNLGIMGLTFLILFIINTFKHAKYELIHNFNLGRFRMTYLVILLLYNVTEAQFKGLTLIWFVFILLAIEVPKGFQLDSDYLQQEAEYEPQEYQ